MKMKWKLAGWIALAVLLAWAAQPGTRSGQASQQASDADKARVAKAQNEKANASNALIPQLNSAMENKQWQQAEDLLKQLVEINPDAWLYRQALGNAQLNLGKYDDAVKSYDAGNKLAQTELESKTSTGDAANAERAKTKAGVALMLTSEGNAYIKLKKTDLAIAAYTKAAELDPNPAVAYFNLCATQYNMGNMAAAEAACEKAIAADPKKADAYFIKGSALYGDGKLGAQGKYILPPGTVEALKKYLELAPDGGHASDVKAMLEAAGVKI
jgi:tetratricopeptide (TPR) repeat protein